MAERERAWTERPFGDYFLMSGRPRRGAKVDRNQKQIVEALRAAGASVHLMNDAGNGAPDLLCGFRGTDFKIEIKHPDRVYAKEPEKRQAEWQAKWQGQPTITVRNIDQALIAIGAK